MAWTSSRAFEAGGSGNERGILMNPKSIARNLLIHYLLVLLVPVTLAILPPATGNWWLLKGLGGFIGIVTIGNFLSQPFFHINMIGKAYGGFLFLMVVYGCALVFRDSSFGLVPWVVSALTLFSQYRMILERVKEKAEGSSAQPRPTSTPPKPTAPDAPGSKAQMSLDATLNQAEKVLRQAQPISEKQLPTDVSSRSPPGAGPTPRAAQWLYFDQQACRRGPVSEAELERLFASGEIRAGASVWSEGLPKWVPFLERHQQNAPQVTPQGAPPAMRKSATSQATPPNQMSPWHRARKPAGTAFSIGTVAGIAAGLPASNQPGFSFAGRMLFTLLGALFIGLLFAAVTFVVAGLYFAAKGGAEVAALPSTTKVPKQGGGLVWAGIIGFIVVLWLIGKSQQDNQPPRTQNTTELNPASQPAASPAGNATEPDAKAQAAVQFEKDFYEKYPDLKPYSSVCDAVAAKLYQSGSNDFLKLTRDERMQAFAEGAREEIARRQQVENAQSAVTIGWRYQNGSGVEQDYAKAAYWYRIAAGQGDPVAQNNLGVLYETGRGVPKNFKEAYKWYLEAAKNGNAPAQSNLGLLFRKGHGVKQDTVQAYAMFCIAAERGCTNAPAYRDSLAESLTPDQVTDARQRVEDWKAINFHF